MDNVTGCMPRFCGGEVAGDGPYHWTYTVGETGGKRSPVLQRSTLRYLREDERIIHNCEQKKSIVSLPRRLDKEAPKSSRRTAKDSDKPRMTVLDSEDESVHHTSPRIFCGRRYVDEYEEGKAELGRYPKMQLKNLVKEKLIRDGIRLSAQPYSNPVSLQTCFFKFYIDVSVLKISFLSKFISSQFIYWKFQEVTASFSARNL